MFRGKESIFVTIICAAGMGMFVALWFLDFAVVRISACEASETRGLCLRGWISALSGWAAAIGALIAAGLTIAKLREQIADQQKQTMHITGDGQPILEFDKLGSEACLVIKNYNRRKLQLVAIENRSSHIIMASMLNRSIGYDDNFKVQANQTIDYFGGHNFFCSGWENQSTSIPKLEIKCKMHTESLSDYPPRMNAIIHCILCDEHNTRIQLSVKETA